MLTAVRLAWDAAGRPSHPKGKDVQAGCVVCGAPHERTIRAKDALGKNYDYASAVRPSLDTVCEPCAWALAGKPPHTLRLWSIATTLTAQLPAHSPVREAETAARDLAELTSSGADDRQIRAARDRLTVAELASSKVPVPVSKHLHLCNRRDTSVIIGLLTNPPDDHWAVAVAQSGQKHLLPYTQVNAPGTDVWEARWEATNITSTPNRFRRLLGAVAALRVAGHHPDTITRCRPSVPALRGDGLTAWRRHEPTIRPYAGSPIMDLALFLTTKETIHDLANRYA